MMSRMKHECYCFQTSKGLLAISPSRLRPWLWDLRLDGKLIRPDYEDPHAAAHYASRSDFGDEELDRLLIGLQVPDDLERWRRCSEKELTQQSEGTSARSA